MWTLIQGNVADVIRWAGRTSLVEASFSVVGAINASFTPVQVQSFRVEGDIAATFVTGGSVSLAGGFTHTGDITATFLVSVMLGFSVPGKVDAIFYSRGGQQMGCIAPPDVADPAKPSNAVH